MKKNIMSLGLILAMTLSAFAAEPELKAPALVLGSLIADHAVLQRDMPVPIWGTAEPGEEVTVTIAGQLCTSRAGADGSWHVELAPMCPAHLRRSEAGIS